MIRQVIDLTQLNGGGETSITINKVNNSPTKSFPSDFLTEILLGGDVMKRGCIFAKDNIAEFSKFSTFKIAFIYLPKDFQHVPVTFGITNTKYTVTLPDGSDSYGSTREQDIFAPIVLNLLNYEENSTLRLSFHPCDNNYEKQKISLTTDGNYRVDKNYRFDSNCDEGVLQTAREGCIPCARSLYDAKDFVLFYYKGYINLPENQDKVEGEFFLIPLYAPSGTIVYYVIRKRVGIFDYNYQAKLNWFYAQLNRPVNASTLDTFAEQITAKSPMRFDDYLSVFLVSEIYFEEINKYSIK